MCARACSEAVFNLPHECYYGIAKFSFYPLCYTFVRYKLCCVHTTTAVKGNNGQYGENNAIFVTVTANRNISKARKFSFVVALIRFAARLETVECDVYQQIAPHVLAQVLLVLPA